MSDLRPFGFVILLVSLAVVAAALSSRLSERLRVPAPALFLIAAAIASDLFPTLGSLPIITEERVVTVALIYILFDGGMQIGWKQFKDAAATIFWIGVAGTFLTAGAIAVLAHAAFDFDWRLALLLGAALAPTDPAMVFSVLGRREVSGRTGTILMGESGVNDPVGIALMAVLLASSGSGGHAIVPGLGTFALQMTVGAVVGVLGGYLLVKFMRHVPLPNAALYPIRALAAAAVIYAVADVLYGSGFLAVLLAGVIAGDARAPYKHEIERFASGVSSLAEIVVFIVLGLTIDLGALASSDALWVGLVIAVALTLVIRPVIVGLLMVRTDLAQGEKLFVLWAGLKGAVPIVLGLFVLGTGEPGTQRLYHVVFIVVLFSAIVQGGLVPTMAHWLHVPMRVKELEPWTLGVRFRTEPSGLHRHFVAPGSRAEGRPLGELDLGEDAWISLVSRGGALVPVHGGTPLRAGDEVLAIAGPSTDLAPLFAAPDTNNPRKPTQE